MPRTPIKDLEGAHGAVEVIAWIAGSTEDCVVLRDYSGVARVRVCSEKVGELKRLPRESTVYIKGYCRRGVLDIVELKVLHKPDTPPAVDYLRDPRGIGVEEYARYSPWYLRHPAIRDTIELQYHILRYARDYLHRRGFIELLPPMASVVSDPGLRGARKLKTVFYGVEYELTSSVIMYKQASAAVYERIYFVARNIREEPPENISTGRHLAEFTQLDLEWAFASLDDVIELAEDLLKYIGERLVEEKQELLERLGSGFEGFKPPFPRIRYDEALEIVGKLGYSVKWGREPSHEAETALAEYYGEPVWLVGFPVISRGFYYYPDPSDPRYNLDFNLLLPRGYGEVIDGGSREYRFKELVKRIKMLGEPLEKYSWFLELAKTGGIPPSTGFGLGVERLTRYIAGHKHIAYAVPYPKLPGLPGTP